MCINLFYIILCIILLVFIIYNIVQNKTKKIVENFNMPNPNMDKLIPNNDILNKLKNNVESLSKNYY